MGPPDPVALVAPTVLNLGGEGEAPGAIDVNARVGQVLRASYFSNATSLIEAFAHQMPIRSGCIDKVVANRFPIHHDEVISTREGHRVSIEDLATEIFRILRPGGQIEFHCSDCDRLHLLDSFASAGFAGLEIKLDYIFGDKP